MFTVLIFGVPRTFGVRYRLERSIHIRVHLTMRLFAELSASASLSRNNYQFKALCKPLPHRLLSYFKEYLPPLLGRRFVIVHHGIANFNLCGMVGLLYHQINFS